jgi:acyl-CoA synthetase (AMP-forming)/AMP-acid ligase II
MTFWHFDDSDNTVVSTPLRKYSYKEINSDIKNKVDLLETEGKELCLILCENTYDVLVMYLATLRTKHVAMLIGADIDESLLDQIISTYKPLWIYTKRTIEGYKISTEDYILIRTKPERVIINPDLCLMLSTSGTTGSQKFVRLSYQNIQSNAESISEYLKMNDKERGIANLPISYSYGLSIINSHLVARATILLTHESVLTKSFWSFFKEQEATSFPGVPFTYQMLQKMGFLKMDLSHLRYFTQAGGRLNEKLINLFANYAVENRKEFYVMYGQTEASPRISYIPPEKLLSKCGTIGIPIPNGELQLDPETNELIYLGPNVMMGYATELRDLEKSDEQKGILRTGDVANVDIDGFFTITGRLKRFIKLFGLRINLDEVERILEGKLNIVVACSGEDDRMVIVVESEEVVKEINEVINSTLKLHHSAYRIIVETIPRFLNGKINYSQIKEWL